MRILYIPMGLFFNRSFHVKSEPNTCYMFGTAFVAKSIFRELSLVECSRILTEILHYGLVYHRDHGHYVHITPEELDISHFEITE